MAEEVVPPEQSPFSVPPVTSGYPLDEKEREAIERVLRQNEHEREREESEPEAA